MMGRGAVVGGLGGDTIAIPQGGCCLSKMLAKTDGW